MANLLNARWLSQVLGLIGLKPKARALQKLQIRIQGVPEFEIRLGETVALRLWPDAQLDDVANQIAESLPSCLCHYVGYMSYFPGTLQQWLLKKHNNDRAFVKQRLRGLQLYQLGGSMTGGVGGDLLRIFNLAATPKGTDLVMFDIHGISPTGRIKFLRMFPELFKGRIFMLGFVLAHERDDGSYIWATIPDAIEVSSDWALSNETSRRQT